MRHSNTRKLASQVCLFTELETECNGQRYESVFGDNLEPALQGQPGCSWPTLSVAGTRYQLQANNDESDSEERPAATSADGQRRHQLQTNT